jgi:hypothetical protein
MGSSVAEVNAAAEEVTAATATWDIAGGYSAGTAIPRAATEVMAATEDAATAWARGLQTPERSA